MENESGREGEKDGREEGGGTRAGGRAGGGLWTDLAHVPVKAERLRIDGLEEQVDRHALFRRARLAWISVSHADCMQIAS